MGGVSTHPPTRPRQVTLAAWLIMIGSVIVVAMVFDKVAGLHTLETRESVERFLAKPPGADLGVGVQGVLDILRTVAMVAAGCATAAAILGYQVLRRSRSARLALTILAVPLFLTGLVTGGFVSSVVAASAVMLWLQPARDWFSTDASARSVARSRPARPTVDEPCETPRPSAAQARPVEPAQHTVVRAPASSPPSPVVWACALTWVFSGLTALGMLIVAAAVAIRPELMLDEAHRQNPDLAAQGVTNDMLAAATYVLIGMVVLWCLGAVVLAVLVYRRMDWARVLLVVSASLSGAVSLIGCAVGAFLLVLPLVAAVVTFAMLVRPDSRLWFKPPVR
jgi:hypothetical protein